MAGYSGTPLVQKLGIKPGARFALIDPPPDFDSTLGVLPEGACLVSMDAGDVDVVVMFVQSTDSLIDGYPRAAAAIKKNGSLWIGWPKKSSGVKTDVHEQLLRDVLLPTGLVDNKVCAIDDVWSGLRFVWRVELR